MEGDAANTTTLFITREDKKNNVISFLIHE